MHPAGAERGLGEAAVTDVDVVTVPGSFELPVACARLARTAAPAGPTMHWLPYGW
ncbi:hypothetical protein BH24ACT8_BH24ACT8_20470 [soil metagenome]